MRSRFIIAHFCFCLLLLNSCKKATPAKHSGIKYFPLKDQNRLLEYSISGYFSDGNQINFLYPTQSSYLFPNQQAIYDLQKQELNLQPFPNSDPSEYILGARCIGPDKYVVRIQDKLHDTMVNGYRVYREKIGYMDAQHHIIQEVKINNASTAGYNINENEMEVFSNGNVMVGYNYNNGTDTWIDLVYLDKNLKIKWKKQLERGPSWDHLNRGIMEFNNHIYVLIATYISDVSGAFFRVMEYDTTGKLLHTVTQTVPGALNLILLPASHGFNVFGNYHNNWEHKMMMVGFDEDCNLLSAKYKDFSEISETNDELYIGTFEQSNVIFKDGKYYLTHLYTSNAQTNYNLRNKFIRMNQDFGIEKIQTLEISNMPKGMARYLSAYGDHFISIASSNWNGLPGLSIIETDADGNIIR